MAKKICETKCILDCNKNDINLVELAGVGLIRAILDLVSMFKSWLISDLLYLYFISQLYLKHIINLFLLPAIPLSTQWKEFDGHDWCEGLYFKVY